MVLVLKHLRRRDNGLKSHPTDLEKPGIEPATPGLQDIGLSPTPHSPSNTISLTFFVEYIIEKLISIGRHFQNRKSY